MKISPIAGPGQTVGAPPPDMGGQPSMAQRIRSLKMNVNRTPEYVPEPPQDPTAPPVTLPVAGAKPAEMPISDASSVPASAAPEENQPLSPQLAALAREKRALQVKERAIADREKALEEKSGLQGSGIPKEQLISNPLGTLLDNGVTWEQLTDAVLKHQQGHNPEVAALKQRLAELETGIDKKLTDRDAQQEQEALGAMEKEAKVYLADGDDFELVRETGSLPDVMRLIKETYKKSGEVLDVREALGLIESELVDEATKLATLKKIQQKTAPAPVQQQPSRGMRTLTNRDTASVPMDRRARALAAWQGTLKK